MSTLADRASRWLAAEPTATAPDEANSTPAATTAAAARPQVSNGLGRVEGLIVGHPRVAGLSLARTRSAVKRAAGANAFQLEGVRRLRERAGVGVAPRGRGDHAGADV
jgi:hypothetical protein